MYVFCGLTISEEEVRQLCPFARTLPPVRAGDVLQVLKFNPSTIVIIDGYFEQTATVWHKEILFALERGVNVVGLSSMGALRASELSAHGMIGFGEVYRQYQAGSIIADDEVAVAITKIGKHLDSTIPIVNIRASLRELLEKAMINEFLLDLVLKRARSIHFKDRTFARLQDELNALPVDKGVVDILKKAMSKDRITDIKREDAINFFQLKRLPERLPISFKACVANNALLQALATRVACDPFPYQRNWRNQGGDTPPSMAHNKQAGNNIRLLARLLCIAHALSDRHEKPFELNALQREMHRSPISKQISFNEFVLLRSAPLSKSSHTVEALIYELSCFVVAAMKYPVSSYQKALAVRKYSVRIKNTEKIFSQNKNLVDFAAKFDLIINALNISLVQIKSIDMNIDWHNISVTTYAYLT